jgi:hypothetical protein
MRKLYNKQHNIQVFDDLVPHIMYCELLDALSKLAWQISPQANNQIYRIGTRDLNHANTEQISDLVSHEQVHPPPIFQHYKDWLLAHVAPKNTKIVDLYLTANTSSSKETVSKDEEGPGVQTCVLFLNQGWRSEWRGETGLFNGSDEIICEVLPQAKRLLSFPSHYRYIDRPPSTECKEFRVALVAKLEPPKEHQILFNYQFTAIEKSFIDLLQSIGSAKVYHSGRSLLMHLVGTFKFLQMRGETFEVCLAGLFHSVYGTSIFQVDLPLDREKLRQKIGERTEHLVWLFCVLQRPQCWQAPNDAMPLVKGGTVAISEQDRRDLLAIESANLDEQGILRSERRLGVATQNFIHDQSNDQFGLT